LLRDEAEDSIRAHGWKRRTIDNLAKLDSFLKESMRVNGLGCSMIDLLAFLTLLN
jgi:hypothetical protein